MNFETSPAPLPSIALSSMEEVAALGGPHDTTQQRPVLEATLALLALNAPLDPVYLDEQAQ